MLLKKKYKLYRDSLTLKNTVSINRYKIYRNKVNAIIRRQKNAAYKQFCCNNNCSDMWVKIKKLTDHKKYNTIPDNIYYGNNIFSNCERKSAFNKFFRSIATDLQDKYLPIVNSENRSSHERYLKNPQKNTFYFSPISVNDILTAIGDCKSKSSLDFCNIDMNIIKIVFNFILDPLTYIFNLIICDSTIPDNMKISVITPLLKKGKLDDINNYRPISLLSQFSKISEKIIYNRFLHFNDKHNLLYAKQYGFIRNSSTSHALYDHYNFIESNLERNNKVASLFLDLKKAFDLVDHKILFNKLKYYGFRGTSNRLIVSYLKDRMLSTRIDNELSERNIINVGVPQGSILGPLLFILYINDIHMALHNLNINFNLILFADDTSVSISEPSNKILCNSLNLVILNLHEWFTNNRLILNIDKTKVLPYKDAHIIKAISINSTNICLVSSYTFIGVIIDNN